MDITSEYSVAPINTLSNDAWRELQKYLQFRELVRLFVCFDKTLMRRLVTPGCITEVSIRTDIVDSSFNENAAPHSYCRFFLHSLPSLQNIKFCRSSMWDNSGVLDYKEFHKIPTSRIKSLQSDYSVTLASTRSKSIAEILPNLETLWLSQDRPAMLSTPDFGSIFDQLPQSLTKLILDKITSAINWKALPPSVTHLHVLNISSDSGSDENITYSALAELATQLPLLRHLALASPQNNAAPSPTLFPNLEVLVMFEMSTNRHTVSINPLTFIQAPKILDFTFSTSTGTLGLAPVLPQTLTSLTFASFAGSRDRSLTIPSLMFLMLPPSLTKLHLYGSLDVQGTNYFSQLPSTLQELLVPADLIIDYSALPAGLERLMVGNFILTPHLAPTELPFAFGWGRSDAPNFLTSPLPRNLTTLISVKELFGPAQIHFLPSTLRKILTLTTQQWSISEMRALLQRVPRAYRISLYGLSIPLPSPSELMDASTTSFDLQEHAQLVLRRFFSSADARRLNLSWKLPQDEDFVIPSSITSLKLTSPSSFEQTKGAILNLAGFNSLNFLNQHLPRLSHLKSLTLDIHNNSFPTYFGQNPTFDLVKHLPYLQELEVLELSPTALTLTPFDFALLPRKLRVLDISIESQMQSSGAFSPFSAGGFSTGTSSHPSFFARPVAATPVASTATTAVNSGASSSGFSSGSRGANPGSLFGTTAAMPKNSSLSSFGPSSGFGTSTTSTPSTGFGSGSSASSGSPASSGFSFSSGTGATAPSFGFTVGTAAPSGFGSNTPATPSAFGVASPSFGAGSNTPTSGFGATAAASSGFGTGATASSVGGFETSTPSSGFGTGALASSTTSGFGFGAGTTFSSGFSAGAAVPNGTGASASASSSDSESDSGFSAASSGFGTGATTSSSGFGAPAVAPSGLAKTAVSTSAFGNTVTGGLSNATLPSLVEIGALPTGLSNCRILGVKLSPSTISDWPVNLEVLTFEPDSTWTELDAFKLRSRLTRAQSIWIKGAIKVTDLASLTPATSDSSSTDSFLTSLRVLTPDSWLPHVHKALKPVKPEKFVLAPDSLCKLPESVTAVDLLEDETSTSNSNSTSPRGPPFATPHTLILPPTWPSSVSSLSLDLSTYSVRFDKDPVSLSDPLNLPLDWQVLTFPLHLTSLALLLDSSRRPAAFLDGSIFTLLPRSLKHLWLQFSNYSNASRYGTHKTFHLLASQEDVAALPRDLESIQYLHFTFLPEHSEHLPKNLQQLLFYGGTAWTDSELSQLASRLSLAYHSSKSSVFTDSTLSRFKNPAGMLRDNMWEKLESFTSPTVASLETRSSRSSLPLLVETVLASVTGSHLSKLAPLVTHWSYANILSKTQTAVYESGAYSKFWQIKEHPLQIPHPEQVQVLQLSPSNLLETDSYEFITNSLHFQLPMLPLMASLEVLSFGCSSSISLEQLARTLPQSLLHLSVTAPDFNFSIFAWSALPRNLLSVTLLAKGGEVSTIYHMNGLPQGLIALNCEESPTQATDLHTLPSSLKYLWPNNPAAIQNLLQREWTRRGLDPNAVDLGSDKKREEFPPYWPKISSDLFQM